MDFKFVPVKTFIDITFWLKLNQLKIEEYGLDQNFIHIYGNMVNDNDYNVPLIINLDGSSFEKNFLKQYTTILGSLFIYNTLESFKQANKKQILHDFGHRDIKKFKYHYWIAYPAFSYPSNITCTSNSILKNCLNDEKLNLLEEQYIELRDKGNNLFYIDLLKNDIIVLPADGRIEKEIFGDNIIFAITDPSTITDSKNTFLPGWFLRNYLAWIKLKYDQLRDKYQLPLSFTIQILSLKSSKSTTLDKYAFTIKNASTIYQFSYKYLENFDYLKHPEVIKFVGYMLNSKGMLEANYIDLAPILDPYEVADSASKLNIRLMKWRAVPDLDLENVFQTKCLLLGAGTLGCNVARCLLGWGITTITFVDNGIVSYSNPSRQSLYSFNDALKCSRQNSRADEGTVKKNGGDDASQDFESGEIGKAQIAARAIKNIYPKAKTSGHTFNIPCPGHFYEESDKLFEQVDQLENLIDQHDVLFLLTDTRESRWLPTVIGAARNKIVLTAALGLDSYLIMRHGKRALNTGATEIIQSQVLNFDEHSFDAAVLGSELGCYFCNDIVGPTDTLHDRTLDQQCTVTRPGLSFIASGLCVELLLSLLQHPLKNEAPAIANNNPKLLSTTKQIDTPSNRQDHFENKEQFSLESCLGIIPHQIRGFLSNFSMIHPISYAFNKCTACSPKILNTYANSKKEFLTKTFDPINGTKYLEDISGLKKLLEEAIANDMSAYSSDNSE